MTRTQVEESLQDIYRTLEDRVGHEMARKLTPIQLSQFSKIVSSDEAVQSPKAGEWLESNVPDYREIVEREISYILRRLREARNSMDQRT